MLPEVTLAVRVRGRHPWFFRKMVRKPARPLPAGGPVRVVDRDGQFIGVGFFNARTELALRIVTHEDVPDFAAWLGACLDDAIALREDTLGLPRLTDAYRLVHAEGDGFPGLILDRLGDALVAQVATRGVMLQIEALGERLRARYPKLRLVLTADKEASKREGFDMPPPVRPQATVLHEHGLRYEVEPGLGHKTGFFADQRDNRLLLRGLARGRNVLDLCCHTGGFAANAAKGGARKVVAIDLDEDAVAATQATAARNGLRLEVRHEDAFTTLRQTTFGAYDLVILDPPKWVDGKGGLDAGLPRYMDFNRLAFEKLARGALLVTCSCSGAVSAERFEAVVRQAAADAGRDARILYRLGAGPDHPIALECPETGYLKVLVLQVS